MTDAKAAADVKHRQRLRGSDKENNAYTGLEGEITVDLTTPNLRLHDGKTTGGVAVAMAPELYKLSSRVGQVETSASALSKDLSAFKASLETIDLGELA